MTPEQRKARRQELAAEKKAAIPEQPKSWFTENEQGLKAEFHRGVLSRVFEEDTGENSYEYTGSADTEHRIDTPAFVDWLILRYVAAAGSSYAMTEADTMALADTMRKNEKRRPTKKERELVERYVGKEGI